MLPLMLPFKSGADWHATNNQPFATPRRDAESGNLTRTGRVIRLAKAGVLETVEVLDVEFVQAVRRFLLLAMRTGAPLPAALGIRFHVHFSCS